MSFQQKSRVTGVRALHRLVDGRAVPPGYDEASLFRYTCRRMTSSFHHRLRPVLFALVVLAFVAQPAGALDPRAPLSRHAQQTWRTENGLPQNSVHQVLQTRDGFVWLATEGGLARFDGYDFTNFDKQSSPALPNNDIRCLLEDRNGALWIGTANGLARLQDGRTATFLTADGLPADTIQALHQSSDGTLWVLTAAGLARGSDSKFQPFGRTEGLPSDRVTAITETTGGTLWVATNAGLASIRDQRVSDYPALLSGSTISALAAGDDDSLLIATQDGVKRYAHGTLSNLSPEQQLSEPVERLLENKTGVWASTMSGVSLIRAGAATTWNAANGLPGARVETIFSDREGATWIGTTGGIARYANGQLSTLATSALSRASIVSIFEDREGSLWMGSESDGVSILREQKFSTWTTQEGLSSDATSAVLQSADGAVWVGTNGGGLNRIAGGKVNAYTAASGLASNIVLALAADAAGNLWVGTPDGLMRYWRGAFTTYTSADGLADDFVRSLLADRDGSLWIGTRRGLTHWQNNQFKTLTRSDGLGSNLVGAMLQARDGAVWVATFGGLTRIHDGHIETFTIRDGLSGNVITALHQDASGTLWIGTNGDGLSRWPGEKSGEPFFSYARAPGLPKIIYAMLGDESGNLWFSSDQGICRVSSQALRTFQGVASPPIPIALYGTADGMRTREAAGGSHPAAWRTSDGRLWFATQKGLAVIDPQQMRENLLPPPVVIERITVDDHIVPLAAFADVTPGHSHFAFEYAGLSYVAPQKVRYRYKLEGFDRGWTEAGARRIAYYTNIPAGRYRFLVQAANNDGVWNEAGASIRFRLQPHFYETVWFAVAAAAVLALIIFLLYRLRVRRIQREFDVVIAERNRLAREIHDTLAQGFVAVSVQLELMSQLLSASALDPAKQQLQRTRELVRDGLADARRSIWDLRSNGKDAETLPARLRRMLDKTLQQIAEASALATHFEVTGTYRQLASAVENELLRVAQEAVTNVVRHSGANNVTVRLIYDPRQVVLEVADDGCGFEPATARAEAHGHFGLTGMRERTQQLRGQVTIESAPGTGTRVRVEAPTE